MGAIDSFNAVCRAMAQPSFYPHPVEHLERRDTHISSVFLTGHWVYKLKKPVNFGFLDFSRLEDRKHYCQQEVTLNRRLSRAIYIGVETVCRSTDGRIRLGSGGLVLDYLVKMRQLPEPASLLEKVRSRDLTVANMEDLGRFLAGFYQSSRQDPQIDRFGSPDLIAANMEDNFRQTQPFLGQSLDREPWEFIRQVSRSFLRHHARLLLRRVRTGHICDGHGDLRPDHVYFCRGIQIIDCIEFNDRFRYGDAAIDLAFLHMDLDRINGLQWSLATLAAYVETARDPQLYRLMDFYACYRAMVRVKVDCLRCTQLAGTALDHLQDRARQYLRQAYCHAVQMSRPTLWLVCGLPATGKSTIASGIAEVLEVDRLQSDAIRRAINPPAGTSKEVPGYGQGLYQPRRKQQVYARLLGEAHDRLKRGRPVIVDATFGNRKWRNEAARLAADSDCNLIAVECLAADSTVQERLQRRQGSSDLSDARLQHFTDFKRDFEALTEIPEKVHLPITTERPPGPLLHEVFSRAYRLQCVQVRDRIRR